MTSIKEVAAEAKVSLSTVSKVLNNREDAHISLATRERVRAAAGRIGYHPSAIARGLAGKRMNSVGLVLAYDQLSITSDPYLGQCLDGILHVNKRRRQKTVIFTEDSWEEALGHVPSYCDGHCDGLMVIIPRTDSRIVEALKERRQRVPFLLVGDSRDDDGLVCVDVDNVAAAHAAVSYLVGLGHRRIAAFCGNHDFCSNGQRLEGYRQALDAAGIPYDPELVFAGEYWEEHGRANVLTLLDRFSGARAGGRPTAVFCFNDNIAAGALRGLAERGVGCPDDISVVGFDDIPGSAQRTPGLTTVRQPTRRVGERAAETLLAYIAGEIGPGHREFVPGEIVVRGSAGPAPGLTAAIIK